MGANVVALAKPLRENGIDDKVHGCGSLLREH